MRGDKEKREWRRQGWSREVGGGDKRENGMNGRRKRGGEESGSGSLKLRIGNECNHSTRSPVNWTPYVPKTDSDCKDTSITNTLWMALKRPWVSKIR